ncbi:uncharacterized protein LOC108630854 isoform X5 [Ceratina calcarata]|uniref:Uncharacterized protein LOC108630854 isoform X5 n=1 Tax=Ceratina calcarata TaxID=156304 RepID=A0AAJ7SA15_9HYME|nr:uncharacterized protein LOC108630854 isoform X5 [Ceratina calcarata]
MTGWWLLPGIPLLLVISSVVAVSLASHNSWLVEATSIKGYITSSLWFDILLGDHLGHHPVRANLRQAIFCFRNDESLCSCCWSAVLAITRGWRRALFYLPLSCILAWKPHSLWLSYVAAGLLAVLSLLHITSSALENRGSCHMSNATDSVGESLLNTRPENYDRFEEVLVTEVLDDGVSGPTGRVADSDGEI